MTMRPAPALQPLRPTQAAILAAFCTVFGIAACSPAPGPLGTRAIEEVAVEVVGASDAGLEAAVTALPEVFRRWRAIAPQAPLPDVYLVTGRDGAAPPGAEGALVVRIEEPVTAEDPAGRIAADVALELVRLYVPPGAGMRLPLISKGETLLSRALEAGAHDLLAQVVAGRHPAPELLDWGRTREEQLWEAFEPRMGASSSTEWAPPVDPEEDSPPPPADPTRYVGYRIALGLWEAAPDRRALAADLLNADDPEDLLRRSGYAGDGPAPAVSPTTRGLDLPTWPGVECALVRSRRVRMHGCTSGAAAGVPVVLLTPPDADHRSWHRVAPLLSPGARIVVYDPAGTGSSEPTEGGDGPEIRAHDLAGFLEVVAGDGPYFLGTTRNGAGTAAAFTALYPWRVAGTLEVGPETRLVDAPGEVASALLAGLREAARGSGSPPASGEPVGCWRPEPAPPAASVVRLEWGGGRPEVDPGRHPVVGVERSRVVGWWRPLDRSRIAVAVGAGPEAAPMELDRDGSGAWRGAGMRLLRAPCERPD